MIASRIEKEAINDGKKPLDRFNAPQGVIQEET
jgi:hypothetical protein